MGFVFCVFWVFCVVLFYCVVFRSGVVCLGVFFGFLEGWVVGFGFCYVVLCFLLWFMVVVVEYGVCAWIILFWF